MVEVVVESFWHLIPQGGSYNAIYEQLHELRKWRVPVMLNSKQVAPYLGSVFFLCWFIWMDDPMYYIDSTDTFHIGLFLSTVPFLFLFAFPLRRFFEGACSKPAFSIVPAILLGVATVLILNNPGLSLTHITVLLLVMGACSSIYILQWGQAFRRLGTRLALFVIIGVELAKTILLVLIFAMPVLFQTICLSVFPLFSAFFDYRVCTDENTRQERSVLFDARGCVKLWRVAACVTLVTFVCYIEQYAGVKQSTFNLLIQCLAIVVLLLAIFAWVVLLKQSFGMAQFFSITFVLMGVSLATASLGGPLPLAVNCAVLARLLMWICSWLLLADVARHTSVSTYAVFAVGLSCLALGEYAALTYLPTISCFPAFDKELVTLLFCLLLAAVLLVFSTGNPFMRRVFTEFESDAPAIGRYANDEERIALVAEKYLLTPREKEVLLLLCQNKSRAAIAQALCLSENTVRGHVANIYAKLGVHSKDELSVFLGSSNA